MDVRPHICANVLFDEQSEVITSILLDKRTRSNVALYCFVTNAPSKVLLKFLGHLHLRVPVLVIETNF
jgi:hypothetical protein